MIACYSFSLLKLHIREPNESKISKVSNVTGIACRFKDQNTMFEFTRFPNSAESITKQWQEANKKSP